MKADSPPPSPSAIDTTHDLSSLYLPPDASLMDALRVLDRSARQVALSIAPTGELYGLMTDGDIRRALVGGATLDNPAVAYVTTDFVSVTPEMGRAEALDLMQSLKIRHLPVLSEDGKLEALHLLGELVAPSILPNEALILAGGKGLRLRPLTEAIPKPLLKVAGRPILERLVHHLAGHGIRKINLAINYLGHMVEEHFGDGSEFGCEIKYLREDRPLGTAGPLRLLAPRPKHPIVVMNGDLVTQIDVLRMLTHHTKLGNLLTMGIKPYTHQVPFGCVQFRDNQVVGLVEKPVLTRLINTGIYILEPELLDLLPEQNSYQMPELINSVLERGGRVGAYQLCDEWTDVGEFNSLQSARGEA